MTKAEWISVIKNTMMKIDEQGIYREPLIERHIQAVYEQMYNELYNQDKTKMWHYVYGFTYLAPGDVDLTAGFTLPYAPVNLQRKGGGVFGVTSTGKTYLITDKQGYDNAVNTTFDTAGFKGSYLAYVSRNKLYANTTLSAGNTLTYDMIPKFTSLSLTDEVMVPGGAEDHFIDRVIDTIQHFRPSDLFNDNTAQ
jgi:hypothetical protein